MTDLEIEREECAKIADSFASTSHFTGGMIAARTIAKLIRKRGDYERDVSIHQNGIHFGVNRKSTKPSEASPEAN